MSECIVLGARKGAIHASKTISKGKCSPPQTRQDQGLEGPVVGGRTEEVQGSGPLHHDGKERSRSGHGRDSQADQSQAFFPLRTTIIPFFLRERVTVAVAVAVGMWETHSVFQGLWEEVFAFHSPPFPRPSWMSTIALLPSWLVLPDSSGC